MPSTTLQIHLGYRVTVNAPSWNYGTKHVSIGVYFDAERAKTVGEKSIQDRRWELDHLSKITFDVEPVLLVKVGDEWRELALGPVADDVEEM